MTYESLFPSLFLLFPLFGVVEKLILGDSLTPSLVSFPSVASNVRECVARARLGRMGKESKPKSHKSSSLHLFYKINHQLNQKERLISRCDSDSVVFNRRQSEGRGPRGRPMI